MDGWKMQPEVESSPELMGEIHNTKLVFQLTENRPDQLKIYLSLCSCFV